MNGCKYNGFLFRTDFFLNLLYYDNNYIYLYNIYNKKLFTTKYIIIMKKLIFTFIFCACLAQVSAQIEINSTGLVGVGTKTPQYQFDVAGDVRATGNLYLGNSASNFLGTASDIPITFKVNNVIAGFTGYAQNSNVSFGYGSLKNPLIGSNNVAIGLNALVANSWGGNNTAIGAYALTNGGGANNTATGYSALYSNITGGYNIATGFNALYSNTEGSYNTATGYSTLYSNTTGANNTAIGNSALYTNTIGSFNIATGFDALYSNTEGSYNTAIGYSALYSNTTGYDNIATGVSALYSNTTGSTNIATGWNVLRSNTTGGENVATGINALRSNTTGCYNVATGSNALVGNTSGSCNTAIGCNATVNTGDLTNATAIGYGAVVTASNSVRIGNNGVSSIGGYANWSTVSDVRAKKNIRADVPGLNFINQLQPVTYNLDLAAMDNLLGIDKTKKDELEKDMPQDLKDKIEKAKKDKQEQVQTGFVAQDVEKTAKSVGYNFSGVNVDEKGIYSLSYAEFVVPLVKSVQELSAKNDQLQKQVDELTGLVNKLLANQAK